ncbi:MAG: hypothetical protein EON90_14870 [Brevundimonas sp.]|nr:MAG: hypothetical protein EON90_14870 [Brevundimonas sp.]
MKKILSSVATAAVLVLSPVAAYAGSYGACVAWCDDTYPADGTSEGERAFLNCVGAMCDGSGESWVDMIIMG